MTRFSIVIPVYKTEKYLECCAESVLRQSLRDFEIILVDDGSPDHCGEMCDNLARRDHRIKVVHRENGGLSAARNTGIRAASGDYILFLDSDDWWSDDSVLEKVAYAIDKTKADVLSFNYRKDYNGTLDSPYFPGNIPSSEKVESLSEMMEKAVYVTGACNKAIRRDLIIENSLFFREGITSEDIDWTLRLALCAETFAFANVIVFVYRQHASSISHSLSPQKANQLCANVKECVRLLNNAPHNKADSLKSFTAYQYGTLLHNVATLKKSERTPALMKDIRDMQWLLACSDNPKIKALHKVSRMLGVKGVLFMLRIRKNILDMMGKGV